MRWKSGELECGHHRSRPCAEVLCGERLVANRLDVVIHVARFDSLPFAGIVHVLKELIARKVATGLDDAREAGVVEIDSVRLAALAAKLEPHARPVDLRVRI